LLFSRCCNGYHLFIFTRELYPVGQWIVLLKQVCEWIGAPIADGICETFSNERAESQHVGKGIRAPGTFNPKTGQCSLIEVETLGPLLDSLPRTWADGIGKVKRRCPRNDHELSLQKSTYNYSLSTEPLVEDVIRKHPILRKGTRNGVLMNLIGDLEHKFGLQKAREIVERRHRTYQDNIGTPLDQHIKEFESAWAGAVAKIRDRFTPAERAIYDQLGSDHQREGFRIIWAFAGAAVHNGKQEFPIGRDSLADRLSITPPGAASVIQKLCEAKAVKQTQRPVRHRSAGRFCWLL
jgi:hypothetical protein